MAKKVKKKAATKVKNKKSAVKKSAAKPAKKKAKTKSAKPALKKKTSKKKSAAAKPVKKVKVKVAKKVTKKKVSAVKVAAKPKKVTSQKKLEVEKIKKPKVAKEIKAEAQAVETKNKASINARPASSGSAASRITIEHDTILTDAEGRILCRIRECDQPSVVESYCRYHYLLYWKKIQIRKKILSEGKLEKYIEELTARYPNKYLDLIKKDLSTEGGFLHAIQELEIDESSDEDDARDFDEERSFIEEVRGVSDSNDRDDSDY